MANFCTHIINYFAFNTPQYLLAHATHVLQFGPALCPPAFITPALNIIYQVKYAFQMIRFNLA